MALYTIVVGGTTYCGSHDNNRDSTVVSADHLLRHYHLPPNEFLDQRLSLLYARV
jgi:hypothetical protein